jgi:hypothetical protein
MRFFESGAGAGCAGRRGLQVAFWILMGCNARPGVSPLSKLDPQRLSGDGKVVYGSGTCAGVPTYFRSALPQ